MPFFDLNLITDPPGDEFVNEETQLNANWTELDKGLSWLQFFGATPPLNVGIETITSVNRHSVWNGTAQRVPYSIPSGWTAWTTLTPVAPYVVRGGFPFKWRRNAGLRKVQVTGGILNTVAASPFPHTSFVTICNAGISSSFAPMGGLHMQHSATAAITGAGIGIDCATARLQVRLSGATAWIEAHYMGQDGGGNFLQFDGLEWYY